MESGHAPVNITFVQSQTFGGSQFPASKFDHAFVSESGPTYALGQQSNGKQISEFKLDANGNVVGSPTTFVQYVGTGRATVAGLVAGPDGLYFTELYKDQNVVTPIDAGARECFVFDLLRLETVISMATATSTGLITLFGGRRSERLA